MKERILQYIKHLGVTQKAFCESLGVSHAYVTSMRKAPSAEMLDKIFETYPNLNPIWLISGVGQMLNDGSLVQIGKAEVTAGSTVTIGGVSATTHVQSQKTEDVGAKVARLEARIRELERDKATLVKMVDSLMARIS